MKVYRVGLISLGKRAYLYESMNCICSYWKERALLFTKAGAETARAWLAYLMPGKEIFVEEGEAWDDLPSEIGIQGAEPKDCPACDGGHT